MSGGVGAGARGGFNPLRGATTGVVMRRRATSGEMARGGLVFVFSLEVAPVSEGVGAGARGGFNPLRGATTGVVIRRRATTEWMARGGWFLFFSWRLLRCRRGILSHPQERTARGGWFFCLEVAPVSEGNSFTCSGAAARGALIFCFVGGAVAVCFEVCCGSMCWPVDRPATQIRSRGAATRVRPENNQANTR